MTRKRRTRQHVIADLGVNYVERMALMVGFAVDRVQSDYGIDLYLYTYTATGEIENGHLLVQVKATDRILLSDRRTIAVCIKRADLERWLGEILPVVLMIYDAQLDVAYWLDIWSYFRSGDVAKRRGGRGTLTLHVPVASRLDADALRSLASVKNAVLAGGER